MILVIILSVIFTLAFGLGGMKIQHALRARSERKALLVKKVAKVIDSVKYSWAAGEIIEYYNSLPDSHRPGMDIEAAVKALDVKYDRFSVNSHFGRERYYTDGTDYDWNCPCVAEYDYDGFYEDKGPHETCVRFPEFWSLKESISDIHISLAEQKRAEADYEKAMVLAGIQGDLGTVDSIVEALSMEKKVIDEVTKEKLEVIK